MFIPIELQKIKEKTTTDFIKIKASYQPKLDLITSKFAGSPYFPKEEPYPKDSRQENLRLLAQINFSELPSNTVFPKTGLLQFFIPKDDEIYGASFSEAEDSQLATYFWKNTDLPSQQIEFSEDEDDLFPVFGEHKISFTPGKDAASFESLEFSEEAEQNPIELLEDISLDDNEADIFYQAYNDHANLTGHKLLGNAFFPDMDPRTSGDWILLLQIDTDQNDDNDIVWGDQGTAQFFIQRDSLMQHDFSHIWYFWHD